MGVGSVGDGVRLCRRRLHEIPVGKKQCPVCRKARDDRHRERARKQGKDAERQREWYRARYADPVFAERERQRARESCARPEVRLARRLGVSRAAAREILEEAA